MKAGDKMDGFLIIDKPKWCTSFDVVAQIRKRLEMKRVGHTGTLDPMATGVMVVCVGRATSFVEKITADDKIYKTTIKLGIETDTADMTGKIKKYFNKNIIQKFENFELYNFEYKYLSELSQKRNDINNKFADELNNIFFIDEKEIEEVLKSFIGKQKQKPPIYSSIRINGKKLYEYARKNEEVEIPERDIEIYDIYDISYDGKDEITYSVSCSKGTYIRSLNEDIAKKLNLIGTTKELRRIKTGAFKLDDAIKIEDVSKEKVYEVEKLFKNKLLINEEEYKKIINGILIKKELKDGLYNLFIDDNFVGVGEINNYNLKRKYIVQE